MPATSVTETGATANASTASLAKFQYAVKTALSLTLAYLIPMAMGWNQPQTAATTVMLIAATGALSDSLQKGVLRIIGTIAGALLGLGLIALFPQDRMIYLLAASVVVAVVIYLYNAYQGDSTVFMLTAVVTLMVFNGGDAEGAFLYGVDRAFMTAFGVAIYTVVATFLWPVRTADNIRDLAADVSRGYAQAFDLLAKPNTATARTVDAQLTILLKREESFQNQFAGIKNNPHGMANYLTEWNAVVSCYEELGSTLVPSLKCDSGNAVAFSAYISNHDALVENIHNLFQQIDNAWTGQQPPLDAKPIEVAYNSEKLIKETHLLVAAVATRAELLQKTQQILLDMVAALDSMLFDRRGFTSGRRPAGKPAFVWLDLENFKTALRAFFTFWIATAIWITFNPPGGFTFVTMCTVLIPLVSYTPVTPKLLFILFTLGFIFALPAYIFLLPQMIHWLQLGGFIFAYAFIGFFVLQGPVSIFFLLGLFTLGIQNTMSYNVDAIMLTMLMFYMICATLIISTFFPFTSKPERIYASLRRRFFKQCAASLRANRKPAGFLIWSYKMSQLNSAALVNKMQVWGAKIDPTYFAANSQEKITRLNNACELLHAQLQILSRRRREFLDNTLIASAVHKTRGRPLEILCDSLANFGPKERFEQIRSKLTSMDAQLNERLGEGYLKRYDRHELAEFYVYLNLQASILTSIESCHNAQQALNWQQLGETKF